MYFEPVTLEDVLEIVHVEKPFGVIVQYGGQTPLKLARDLEKYNVPIIGTTPDMIDMAELAILQIEIRELLAGHQPCGDPGHRHADHLGDERHGARCPRIDFEHVDRAVLDGVLNVHQADDV